MPTDEVAEETRKYENWKWCECHSLRLAQTEQPQKRTPYNLLRTSSALFMLVRINYSILWENWFDRGRLKSVVQLGGQGWPEEFRKLYRQAGYWRGETLSEVLSNWAVRYPNRTAIVDGLHRWSFKEFNDRAEELAAGFSNIGIRARDRVVVQLPNSKDFAVTCFALFRLGAIPALALPAHREREISHVCEITEAVAYIIPDFHDGFDYVNLARELIGRIASLKSVVVAGETDIFPTLDSLYLKPSTPSEAFSADDVALFLLSGGTTGLPKLIPRTHNDYIYNFQASARVCELSEESKYLAVLPVAHNFTLACPGVLGTWHSGGTVVFASGASPDEALPLIEQEKVTITALVPSLLSVWMESVDCYDVDLRSLQLIQVGGSKLTPELAREVPAVFGCRLQQVFGMAEGLLNFTRLDDPLEIVQTTQGRPLSPHDEVLVVDEFGRKVKTGEVGELLVRGPYTIRGYYKNTAANNKSFTAQGFYRSGDLVRLIEGGYLVVEGRCASIINRGGENFRAEEVENILAAYPTVRDVALVGVEDKNLGERVCACIVSTNLEPTLSELRTYLREQGVASFKLPDRIVMLSKIPYTPLGKIDRQTLISEIKQSGFS